MVVGFASMTFRSPAYLHATCVFIKCNAVCERSDCAVCFEHRVLKVIALKDFVLGLSVIFCS
jgi:hypothetical protein